jgi:hypothetical protein
MRPASDEPASESAKPREYFATTHWTMVLNAGRSDSSRARDALAQLCQTYWYPLYAYLRRRGESAADAEDLTQGFFASAAGGFWFPPASAAQSKAKASPFPGATARIFGFIDSWGIGS